MLLALFNSQLMTRRLLGDSRSVINLPGWRWGTIKQIPLVAVSRPLHSGVCETRQDAGLPVLHSKISDSGLLRTRGGQQHLNYLSEVVGASSKNNVFQMCIQKDWRSEICIESVHCRRRRSPEVQMTVKILIITRHGKKCTQITLLFLQSGVPAIRSCCVHQEIRVPIANSNSELPGIPELQGIFNEFRCTSNSELCQIGCPLKGAKNCGKEPKFNADGNWW